ncbi:MarR family winged helix-turn-helix transcriptional regulator [Clostridium felsineum]|uniref:Transcriptional activatory protein BadR n=1 Tax=Clostridium felsineum TaxID=36839 RepID=A0A1S8KXW8_9CLOT|nr:MarR family transcriptional regulator [Clostridium felsineum]URZ08251.1 Transcriptional activatory protein BadR [Clostridium felsineum]URZ13282.1 Transcriptional activatory protein BadR [Clostridium felsineum]
MRKNFKNEELKIIDEIYHLFYTKMLNIRNNKKFKKLENVTDLEMGVLHILTYKPDCIMREIREYLKISRSTLTGVIDRLEKRGFVKRVISEKDRRSFSLELTREGKIAQVKHEEMERTIYKEVLASLEEDEDIDEFLRLSKKIIKNIKV